MKKTLYILLSILMMFFSCRRDTIELNNNGKNPNKNVGEGACLSFTMPSIAKVEVETRASGQVNQSKFDNLPTGTIHLFVFEETDDVDGVSDNDKCIKYDSFPASNLTDDDGDKTYATGYSLDEFFGKKIYIRVLANISSALQTRSFGDASSAYHYSKVLKLSDFKTKIYEDVNALYKKKAENNPLGNFGSNNTDHWQDNLPLMGKVTATVVNNQAVTVPIERLYAALSINATAVSSEFVINKICYANKNSSGAVNDIINRANYEGVACANEAATFAKIANISNDWTITSNVSNPAIPMLPSYGVRSFATDIIIGGTYTYPDGTTVPSYYKVRLQMQDEANNIVNLVTEGNTHYIINVIGLEGAGYSSFEDAASRPPSQLLNYQIDIKHIGGSTEHLRNIKSSKYGYYLGYSNKKYILYGGTDATSAINDISLAELGFGRSVAGEIQDELVLSILNESRGKIKFAGTNDYSISVPTNLSESNLKGSYDLKVDIQSSLGSATAKIGVYMGTLADTLEISRLGKRLENGATTITLPQATYRFFEFNSVAPDWIIFNPSNYVAEEGVRFISNTPTAEHVINIAPKDEEEEQTTAFYAMDNDLVATRIQISQYGLDGAGTTTDPFRIRNDADMQLLKRTIDNIKEETRGVYYKLEPSGSDIDLSVASQMKTTNAFKGILDGDDKNVIINSSASCDAVGLFSSVDGATLKDMTLTCNITNAKYAGSLIADSRSAGNSLTTIEHCHVAENSVISASEGAGGLIGYSDDPITISQCSNTAHIKTAKNAGGIAGEANGLTVNFCQNKYSISPIGEIAGGIIGKGENVTIINSSNIAAINAPITSGGIAGKLTGNVIVANSYNFGKIWAGSTAQGGIVGDATGVNDVKFFNLYNRGEISSTDDNIAGAIYGIGDAALPNYSDYDSSNKDKIYMFCFAENIVNTPTKNDGDLKASEYATAAAFTQLLNNNASRYNSPVKENSDISAYKWTNIGLPEFNVMPSYLAFGAGTSDNPYLINDIFELFQFRDDVNARRTHNKDYKLMTNINLFNNPWTTVGKKDINNDSEGHLAAVSFQGKFEGNNKLIKGLNVTESSHYAAGFFGALSHGGLVQYLNIEGTVTNSYASGDETGGIVGYVKDSDGNTNLNHLSFKGNVSGYNTVGGICGVYHGYSFEDTGFDGCVAVSGSNITATSYNAGGIVGFASNVRIYECKNYATVKANLDRAGGIVGQHNTAKLTLVDNNNYGSVTATNNAGGLVGTSLNTGGAIIITSCSNTAEIKTSVNDCGGIIGSAHCAATFTSCTNSGKITAGGTVGGIIAYMNAGKIIVSNTINSGKIYTTGKYAGGIVGYLSGSNNTDNKFTNCHNNDGNASDNGTDNRFIHAEGGSAAGIIGRLANSHLTIQECQNHEAIYSAGNDIGGILGKKDKDDYHITINSSINNGYISGANYAGGISGTSLRGILRFDSNTNNGAVYVSGSYAGGILGYVEGYDGKQSGQYSNQINRCKNTGAITAISEKAGGFIGQAICNLHNGNDRDTQNRTRIAGGENSGMITAGKFAGGIIGRSEAFELDNNPDNSGTLINKGIIKATTQYAGGIVGYVDLVHTMPAFVRRYTDSKIWDTQNQGLVSGPTSGTIFGFYKYRDWTGTDAHINLHNSASSTVDGAKYGDRYNIKG